MDAIETPTIAPDADRAVPVTDGAGAVADEVIERLGDAIAELSARIQAATYELLALIRQFDTCGG